jgi:chromosome segregation ATPase
MESVSLQERLSRLEESLQLERRQRRQIQRKMLKLKLEYTTLNERILAAEERIRVLENRPLSPIIPPGIIGTK